MIRFVPAQPTASSTQERRPWPPTGPEVVQAQSGSAIPFAVRVTRPQDDPTPDDVITIIRGAATIRARVSA